MILHLPPHSPSDPSRQNTSTYLQEKRDKKINERTLNYFTTYTASAAFVSSEGGRTARCMHHLTKMYTLHKLKRCFSTHIIQTINTSLTKELVLFRPRTNLLSFMHLSSGNEKALSLLYHKG